MKEFRTDRLIIREATEKDAPFIFKLLNNPTWIENIGNRNINELKDAETYIQNSLIHSYKENGHGMYLFIENKNHNIMGICGFLKRKEFELVDIGFAILPEYSRSGYTLEAAKAIIKKSNFPRFLGITTFNNIASQKLLKKIGLTYKRDFIFGKDEKEYRLYSNFT